MPADPSKRYHVSLLGPVKEKIRSMLAQAVEDGNSEQLQECLRGIQERLETRPSEWGEPVKHLHNLKMLMHHAALKPIHVYYAVNEEARLVCVRRIHLMSESPLDEPEND